MFLCLIMFLMMPIIGIPIYVAYYLFDKNKKGILYSVLLGTMFGILAYCFIPPETYDLYRLKLVVSNIANMNFDELKLFIKISDFEIIPLLYSYLISMTNNYNLLQFFVVTLGYSLLFYMLYDYRKETKLDLLSFTAVVLFTIFGFNTLYFISGLYNYIAIILFSFAIYNEYVKNNNKIISYVLYILTLLIHNSMFFPFAILMIYKLSNNKVNLRSSFLVIFVFFFAYYILNFINNNTNISIISKVLDMYNSYVGGDEKFKRLYSGKILAIELIKWTVTIFCILFQKDRKKINGVNGFVLLLSLGTLVMLLRSRVMIRFVMLIQFVGIVPMIDLLKNNNKNKIFNIMMIMAFGFMFLIYTYFLLKNENFGYLSSSIFNNIFKIFKRGLIL